MKSLRNDNALLAALKLTLLPSDLPTSEVGVPGFSGAFGETDTIDTVRNGNGP